MKTYSFVSLFLLLLLIHKPVKAQDEGLDRLASWMTGTFSSYEQSKQDTSYFDISLSISRIWTDRQKDTIWLYVEQARSEMKDKPYRQRVYRLSRRSDGVYESAIFNLASPLRFAGHPEMVEQLTADSLQFKDGCEVTLHWMKKSKIYKGGTREKTCPSDLRGASYATSEVELSETELRSWDRGYDKDGKQVWGAEKGGYIFRKGKSDK